MSTTSTIDPEVLGGYIDAAVPHLRRYFLTQPYTGAHFERLDGGGDRGDVAHEFTASDLVAVTMLSVSVPPSAAIDILGPQASSLTALLGKIPFDVDLWNADADVVSDGSPADQLWRTLESMDGIGWVTAGKLLARKRPRLIPVYDSVVKAALGLDGSFWLPLRRALVDNPDLVERLASARRESQIGYGVSLLRVLDVAIWMPEHNPDAELDQASTGATP